MTDRDELVEQAARTMYEAEPDRLKFQHTPTWDDLVRPELGNGYRRRASALIDAGWLSPDDVLQAKKDAVREARAVITHYLATAEKWRYDRVVWAFAVMLGEIPEDTPEPMSPADHELLRRRSQGDEHDPHNTQDPDEYHDRCVDQQMEKQ